MDERSARLVVFVTTGIEEYQSRLLRGVEPVLDAAGLARVAYLDWGEESHLPADLERFLRRRPPAGVISTPLSQDRHLEGLATLTRELGTPHVLIGADLPDLPAVRADNVTGMRALMAHLLDECGVRRPVFVRGLPYQADSEQREQVFREALATRGLPVHEEHFVEGSFLSDLAHRELLRLLSRSHDVDAVVACNDRSARGCIGALTASGLRVPEDVLVTGFDNEQGALQWPGLTTVDQGLAEQGRAAAELLLDQLAGRPVPGTVTVPSRLVVRDSTAVVPRSDREQLDDALRMVEAARSRLAYQDAAEHLTRTTVSGRTLEEVVGAFAGCLDWLDLRRCFIAVRSDLCEESRPEASGPVDDVTPIPEVHSAAVAGVLDRTAAAGILDSTTVAADVASTVRAPASDAPGRTDPADPVRPADPASPVPAVRLLLEFRDRTMHEVPSEAFLPHLLLPETRQEEFAHGCLVVSPLVLGTQDYGHLILEREASVMAIVETRHVDLARALDAVFHHRASATYAAELEVTVRRRTQELIRRTEELQAQIVIRERAERALQLANAVLRQTAMLDGLTGIANRGTFEEHLAHHWQELSGTDEPMTMLLVDVDLFKRFNDHYGHLAGDAALRLVAECLRLSTADPDGLVARYGGEEFAVVLPRSGPEAGLAVARRFHDALARRAIPHAASRVARVVTASIGIATHRPDRHTQTTHLVAAADRALYQAKQLGRNRTVLVPEAIHETARPTPGATLFTADRPRPAVDPHPGRTRGPGSTSDG